MSKTHWKKLINPDYIGVYALPEGQDMTVTMISVGREIVTSTGGKKEECTVVQLNNNKPLILNVTNSKSISRLYGPYIEDWAGKQITLCASTTKLSGEMVECIRIRPQVMQQQLPEPITVTQLTDIKAAMLVAGVNDKALCDRAGIAKLEDLPQDRIGPCMNWLKKQASE